MRAWHCVLSFLYVQGLAFLHDSELHTHGNLKSSNCVVNSRWSLQVTDYGLFELRHLSLEDGNEHAYYRSEGNESPISFLSPLPLPQISCGPLQNCYGIPPLLYVAHRKATCTLSASFSTRFSEEQAPMATPSSARKVHYVTPHRPHPKYSVNTLS
jgi:hypothetical protein